MRAKKIFSFMLMLVLLAMQPLSALACSTCGCSELCPLSMMKDTEPDNKNKASLSDSIWGNIILKMAYQRDPEMQKMTKHVKGVNTLTSGTIAGAVGGTLAQNIISVAVLNPADGFNDNYLPGSLGLGMSGLINIVFDGNILLNWHLKKKIRARQILIRDKVETILTHLEYSEAACPQAQTELQDIIGKRAAADCIQLWQFSHKDVYAAMKQNTVSDAKINIPETYSAQQISLKPAL